MDDASMFKHARKPMYIALRQLIFMRPRNEFRCFVYEGQMLSVVQYHYDKVFDFLQSDDRRDEIFDLIKNYWATKVHPASPLSNYVFDVDIGQQGRPLMLIEINPWGRSDPCAAGNYDAVLSGGFHFVEASGSA